MTKALTNAPCSPRAYACPPDGPLALVLAAMRADEADRASGVFRTLLHLPVTRPSPSGVLFLLLFSGSNVGPRSNEVLAGWVGITGPSWTTDARLGESRAAWC